MESSVSTVDAVVRPWRTATIVAGAIAAVELAALLAIGAVFLGPELLDWARAEKAPPTAAAKPSRQRAADAPAASETKPVRATVAARPLLPRSQTSVLVLNGNGVAGAAAVEAEAVRAKRYLVAGVGNAPRSDYRRTLVMYRPGHRGEAVRLSRDLRLGVVSPLDGLRRGQLMGAQVAIILGAR